MKTVAEAEFGEEYVVNIVRAALAVLSHIGQGPHLGHLMPAPHYGMGGGGPVDAQPTRQLLLTWRWNEETQRPSVHAKVVEMPAPDPEIMRKVEEDRQVKMLGRMAKQFKG